MNEDLLKNFSEKLVPQNYLSLGLAARKSREKQFRLLLEKRKLPVTGWDDDCIEEFVNYLSSLDSNNFSKQCGLGEREARIACRLVQRRHYGFGHGIGRSGDLLEAQPKAAGSTLMASLTNDLLLDLLKVVGIPNTRFCFLTPMATGMTLNLCFLTFRKLRSTAKYVLWSRIDQKACFKSITTAGLEAVIIEPVWTSEGLCTNLEAFEHKINELQPENILCIFSTTSCFAPRICDDVIELAKIAKKYSLPHLINNAYGIQTSLLTHKIEQASRIGNVDLFVQSTDKNLMVPVGGAIVAGFDEENVKNVARNYVGRASSSQSLDVLMTILSLGKTGYLRLISERREMFDYLQVQLKQLAKNHNEEVLETRNNPISIAFTLKSIASQASMLGSMLFIRGVSGARIITCTEEKTIDFSHFKGWGSHRDDSTVPYVTFAASLGIKKEEIDTLILKLDKCLKELKKSDVNNE